MIQKGLFIMLRDKESLNLYLSNGIYGQLMTPEYYNPSRQSVYYPTLADYACIRGGDHVFFFMKRKIYYGGQILGLKESSAFYLNGMNGPIGRKAKAEVFWDETKRKEYEPTGRKGVFLVDGKEKCQHFIIRFKNNKKTGNFIISDQFYEIIGGLYPYPLPSNTINNMGFCLLTPGETRILLDLLYNCPEGQEEITVQEDISFETTPTEFSPKYVIQSLNEVQTEAELEASVIANPLLLPKELRPNNASVCRQIPISPYKPRQMDRADVCYYTDNLIADGTLPNKIIELKIRRAGKNEIEQVVRYTKWLDRLNKSFQIDTSSIEVYIYAPSFANNCERYIPNEYKDIIHRIAFIDC